MGTSPPAVGQESVVNYKSALQYLDTFLNYEKIPAPSYTPRSFNLKRMERLLKLLGNPQKKLPAIHIAGTKGKGSTAAFLASVLQEAGFKTGLYTSPHLADFRERIRIGKELISKKRVSKLIAEIKPEIEKLQKDSSLGLFTFFEVYTALSLLFFAQEKVDFAVLEVGMGGRLDATNVLNPLVSAITPISFDHTEVLGKTLSSIAREKAGIIKEKSLVITSPQKEEALKVIKEVCRKKKVRLFEVGKDLKIQNPKFNLHYSTFDLKGIFFRYKGLKVSLLGEHQLINAACALGILELLHFHKVKIPEKAIRQGLRRVEWPGRLEVIQKKPFILLDGAQNEASAQALGKSIKEIFPHKRLILLLGISQDKDIKGIGRVLCPLAEEVIATGVDNPRACSPFSLKEELKEFSKKITPILAVKEAFKYAKMRATSDDLICVTGSLYLVGKVKQIHK
jgi:dihydrofolate synthase/folylpolyglutamate synthase